MQLINDDCIKVMRAMPDNSVDSIVTDPPYELGFMGKSWDSTGIANSVEMWSQALRVLKPGGHLLAFSGSRTYHRMVVAIEDAGFEIRDQIMWVYGSGFPKSHNIGKKIDGWDGWGTALKPAHEPIVLARKPIVGTVANNVLTYGVGGLNIDGARVAYQGDYRSPARSNGEVNSGGSFGAGVVQFDDTKAEALGRFPANFIHDGSDEVVALFPDTNKGSARVGRVGGQNGLYENGHDPDHIGTWYGDSGSAARFFYCAKASKRDRNEGADNKHPTVKPTTLMQYLVRLVTPPGGTVLDPFMGSGSTGKACVYEGLEFVGIEQSAEYVDIARTRIFYAVATQGEEKEYELPF